MIFNGFDSDKHTECSAFVTLLEKLAIPFTWYRKGLSDRYLPRLRERWYNIDDLDLILIGIEVGSTLIVFERDCGRFVLVDSVHGKATLEGGFADIIAQADAAVQLRSGQKLDRIDDMGEVWPEKDYTGEPLVTPHEVRMSATVNDRIEEWICQNARAIVIAQHGRGKEPDSDDGSVFVGDIMVFSADEDQGRDEDEIYFAYKRDDKAFLEVTFPARYLWSKDWHDQLQKDTQEARDARKAADLANRRRHVESKRAELKRLEAELSKLEGEGR